MRNPQVAILLAPGALYPVVDVPRQALKRKTIELSVAMGLNMDVRTRSYKILTNPDLNTFKSGSNLKI